MSIAYFDQFDEYAFVTAIERYSRSPHLLSNRVFDIRAEYLRARFPKKSPKELADMACREAIEKCDIILVFNDPAAAFKPAPFDYGWSLNPYSEAIASRLAEFVQTDPNWKLLFVVPSKYLPRRCRGLRQSDSIPQRAGRDQINIRHWKSRHYLLFGLTVHQSVSSKHQGLGNRVWRLLRNRYTLALLVCLFVVNARLFTIKRFGVQEPYMDSFSEMQDYKDAAENNYGAVWNHSVSLHNEHRIVLTRWTNVA
jgi:hypothetical protein